MLPPHCASLQAGYLRYLDAIPDTAFADSCLFHAKDGCSLPRSLRAPVSAAYLCGPLMRLMKG